MNPSRIAVAILVTLLAVPALAQTKSAQRMYKCVDEKGKVFYSDSPSTDCNKGTEMTRHGVVVRKPEKVVATPAKVEKKSAPASAERRDRALMATYTREEEIDAARDRSLEMPNQALKASEARLQKTNQELFSLKKQADSLASQQKPLPADLIEDVNARQKQVAALETEVAQKKAQAEAIRARYESDKLRFRELKGASAATAKN
ncbi:MAG TPA: DUF4124 domain-containing protein [Burkholderiales bacterium]|nr:DUF4124 domain-containing protein [Burkholderiales bacterium]